MKLKFWQRNADNDEGMAGDAVAPDIKVPLKMRVRARWEGYDDPMEYFMLQEELDAYREWLRRMMVRAARPIEEELGELDLEDEAGRWPPERLKFYAKLFDRGIMMPGGAEYALDLAKPLALDETMSCLEIGSRIGGAARLLADKFGVWVTAFEQDAELAAIGMDRSTATGVQKKVPVMHFDASNPDIRKKYFNVVYSLGELYLIEQKDTLLLRLTESLREQGQLLITDYVATGDGEHSDLYNRWLEHSETRPYPWTANRYKDVLNKLKFDIRIAKDESDQHAAQIKQAWASFLSDTQRSGMDPDYLSFLENEMENWFTLVKLLENREIAYYRFYATHD